MTDGRFKHTLAEAFPKDAASAEWVDPIRRRPSVWRLVAEAVIWILALAAIGVVIKVR